jgi:acyl carrier protein
MKSQSDHEVHSAILRLLSESAGTEVMLDTDLRSLDLSSVMINGIVARLEDELGLRVPILLLFDSDTARDLVDAVVTLSQEPDLVEARPPITPVPRRAST